MESICSITPIECSQIKKGHHIIIHSRPTKVVDMSISKTGKHGHMKVNVTGIDILTKKKLDFMGPGHMTIMEFSPIRKEYNLALMEDNTLICTDKNGAETYVNIDQESKIYEEIKTEFDNGKSLVIVVITAPIMVSPEKYVDESAVDSFKEDRE